MIFSAAADHVAEQIAGAGAEDGADRGPGNGSLTGIRVSSTGRGHQDGRQTEGREGDRAFYLETYPDIAASGD